jgi:glucokinase
VSWERVVSGKFGFRHLAQFILERGDISTTEALRVAIYGGEDIGALLHEHALLGDPLAIAVIKLFLKLYGAEAGNLALKGFTLGGLYIGGGIIKQLMPFVAQSSLIESFCAKGRFTEFMRQIPIKIITDEDNALLGAGYYAWNRLPLLG